MAKDYARNARQARKKIEKNQQRKWTAAFVLIIILLASLIYTRILHHRELKQKHLKQHATKTKIIKKTQPSFDFYQILPKMTVQIDKSETTQLKQKVPSKKIYYIQVAAFKRHKDADKLKATLLLQGYNVKIKTDKSKNSTWQRVLTGPYANFAKAKLAKQKLAQNHFRGLILAIGLK
ncbi:MAG: SPOR domain-containing protein [Pseudomonadota bacterium]